MSNFKLEAMFFGRRLPAIPAIAFMILMAAPIAAGQTPADNGSRPPVSIAQPVGPAQLLPASIAGIVSRGEIQEFARESLADLVGGEAAIFQEYGVIRAARREYGTARVELFQTQTQLGAFGLFSFIAGTARNETAGGLGSGSARVKGEVVFWKGRFFVRVGDKSQRESRAGSGTFDSLARALADTIIPPGTGVNHAPLINSLPAASIVRGTETYFLGLESLSARLEHAREMFTFEGDTEAVMADYATAELVEPRSRQANEPAAGDRGEAAADGYFKLVIVECHTPQFATDEMARATSYLESLPENEQQQIVLRRSGNFVVAAINVRERELAEALVGSIEYPYTVKWLRNPLWPTNDPFRTRKAAEMLVSTFGVLGLILLTVIAGGTIFGTTIFLKRRKRQQQVFSDAGGMLRLDIDPFESVILGLPPKREE